MKKIVMVASVLLITLFTLTAFSTEYYVDAVRGSNENSGTLPDKPWKTISYALTRVEATSVNPAVVNVAPGIYNMDIGEIFPLNIEDNTRIIGADFETTIIDADGSDIHVVEIREASNIEFKCFTVTGGSGHGKRIAGGITCFKTRDGYIKIGDCKIQENNSEFAGGAISCYASSPVIENCLIRNNNSGWGGGIFIYVNAKPKIENCTIEHNTASFNHDVGDGGEGGGIFCQNGSPEIIGCILRDNRSISGAGMHFCSNSVPSIRDCVIHDNSSIGDAGYQGSAGGLFFVESPGTTVNCLIYGNSADQGGGIFCYGAGKPKFFNSTIVQNQAQFESGIALANGVNPVIRNCIIWDNDMIYKIGITYSDIEGGAEGEGNIDKDPMFAEGPWGDFYLSCKDAGDDKNSPCLDTGSIMPVMGFNHSDYITRSDGVTDSGRIDIGYHYEPHVRVELTLDSHDFDESPSGSEPVNLLMNINTAPIEIKTDIYLIIQTQDGKFYSGFSWDEGIKALAEGITLPANLSIDSLNVFYFMIPNTKPPVEAPGTYTFYFVAMKPGKLDFISNIASASFTVE